MVAALLRLADQEELGRHTKSCAEKRWFFTREEAQAALDQWRVQAPSLAVYGCTNCGFWHTGNRPTP
jgi:hypothetical protein